MLCANLAEATKILKVMPKLVEESYRFYFFSPENQLFQFNCQKNVIKILRTGSSLLVYLTSR